MADNFVKADTDKFFVNRVPNLKISPEENFEIKVHETR